MKKTGLIFLGLISILASCTPAMQEREKIVASRAAYDFSCPQEQIKLTVLNDSSAGGAMYVSALFGGGMTERPNSVKFGAEGCGQKAVYDNVGSVAYKEGTAPNPSVRTTTTTPKFK